MSWKYFENGSEEEKSFVGDTIVLVIFIISKKNGDIISPFLKISPISEKYIWENICRT
jgi:hypothetical protein